MTKKVATKTAEKEVNQIRLKPIRTEMIDVHIEGTSILVQHNWSEKAKRMIREKKAGKRTKTREICNPEQEGREATHFTQDGRFGIPAISLKASMISVAHKEVGIEKTLVRKSLFVHCDDPLGIIPMECSEPTIREDIIRVANKAPDLRYRPQFDKWNLTMRIEFDIEALTPDDVVNLVNRAGFGSGVGEWRPEKGGIWGRFQVVASNKAKAAA